MWRHSVQPSEKRWAVGASCGLMALLTVPYLLAWLGTPRDAVFMGHIWNPDDPCQYMSWTRQAADGRFFLEDLFTTEPQQGRFTNVFFLALGNVCRLTGASPAAAYAVSRFVFGALLLYVVYLCASVFTPKRGIRRLAPLLAATSSGLGWLYRILDLHLDLPLGGVQCVDIAYVGGGTDAVDLAMPELITAMSLLIHPHFSASMALLLVTIVWGWLALARCSFRHAAIAGVAALLLGNIHTYDIIPAAIALIGMLVLLLLTDRGRLGRRLGVGCMIAALALPSVLYQVHVFRADAVFREKALTITASPPPLSYAVSFGLPLLLAFCGGAHALRTRKREWYPVVVWAVAAAIAPYLPGLSFQRKMVEGLHLPICLLTAFLVMRLVAPRIAHRTRGPRRERWGRARQVAIVATVLLCLPSTLVFLQRAMALVDENNASRPAMPWYYMPTQDIKAMAWLRENVAPGTAMLSSPQTGAYIPGETGCKVFIGHWAETLRYEQKLGSLLTFFRSASEGERRRFLREHGIDLIFIGTIEKALFRNADAIVASIGATLVYEGLAVRIYAAPRR